MPVRTVAARSVAALLGPLEPDLPAYQALAEGLRRLIADGRILTGTRLPSERSLTAALGVSRTTVTTAYRLLRERGYLLSRQGSGSVVVVPGGRPGGGGLLAPAEPSDEVIDLTCAAAAAVPGTAAAYEAAVAELPHYLAASGYEPNGLGVLREALAARFTERGLPTGADQIMVTCGTLAAMAVVTRAYLGPGDRLLLESPSYPNVIATARRIGVRPVALPLDPTGWDPDALEAALRQTSPRAAYLIPDYHNPTGLLMDAPTRVAFGAALARARTLTIVDETVVELALGEAAAPPPLAASTPESVTLGGASKQYWGGLRVGWLRAPTEQMSLLTQARLTLDLGAPILEQLALVHLLAGREQARQARAAEMTASRDALAAALANRLPEWRFRLPTGGLSLWCELPAPRSSALVVAAEQEGLLLASGGQFAVEGGLESFLRLPFTQPADVLVAAVERLARAWDAAGDVAPRSTRRPLVA
ncbi:MAG TPA: PLP-dependent aminotransferase family protein [Candidatus Nanopelagicales bacterium]|jgi:DNA-binding transcriptional MocR family regulator|nr:PLP-dependent aminotransferase family protein [Candidatus Nanopelagicales bacterium]